MSDLGRRTVFKPDAARLGSPETAVKTPIESRPKTQKLRRFRNCLNKTQQRWATSDTRAPLFLGPRNSTGRRS